MATLEALTFGNALAEGLLSMASVMVLGGLVSLALAAWLAPGDQTTRGK